MDKEYFERKIKELTDDKLIDLLQKTSHEPGTDIYKVAKMEADQRGIKFEAKVITDTGKSEADPNDKDKLRKWNWGAFLLAPIWALANRLDLWTILCFVPIVNIGVIFYLGYNGNRLAFEKSKIDSVDDFLAVQKDWGLWGVRIFWFALGAWLVVSCFSSVTNRS